MFTWLAFGLFAVSSAQEAPEPAPATTAAPAETEATPSESSDRLAFEERVVRGQVAAGSVYLFQRKPRQLPGLVPVRRSYRAEIVEPLLAERVVRAPDAR